MKKIIFLSIPVLLPGLLVVLLLVYDHQRPPDWQSELALYMEARKSHLPAQITPLAASQAARPWEFVRSSDEVIPGEMLGSINLPLAYPPETVWCVLLETRPLTPTLPVETRVVFVARHRDIYNTTWATHEGEKAPFSAALRAKLAKIGCTLELGRE